MTLQEGLVLVAATILAAVAVSWGDGTLSPRAGVLLLTVAALAVFAALLHMLARVT